MFECVRVACVGLLGWLLGVAGLDTSESLEAVIGELHAVLDRAAALDLAGVSDGGLDAAVVALGVLRDRAAAVEAAVAGEWDARKVWARHGARSPGVWIAHQRKAPTVACARAPRWGRKLRALPAVAAAWTAGAVTDAHVQRILGVDTPRTHTALVADQVQIVRWAMTLGWRPFLRRLQDWLDTADPDGPQPDDRAGRRVNLTRTIDDTWRLDGWLDAISGTIVAGELARLERLLFLADHHEAAERLGRDPLPHEFTRSAAQRRADALVSMAERSATLPDDGRRARPLFTVLVGHHSLRRILELTNGTELRPTQLAPHLDNALFEHVLFDQPRHVIGISTQRTYRGLLRKAIEVRDRGCQYPGCDTPLDHCQIDHTTPHAAGGPTTQDNGRCYCGPHNRARNHPTWTEPPTHHHNTNNEDDEPPPPDHR